MANVYQAEIIGKRALGEDIFSMQFRAPELANATQPGQFVMVRPSHPANGIDPITPRPFSIYALLEENDSATGFSLIIKVLGRGSRAIERKTVGEWIQITGPLGHGLNIEPDRRYLMVAGGTGIAPVAFAAQTMKRMGMDYKILYGGREAGQVHLDELKEFGLSAEPATEDGSIGRKGLVTDLMVEHLEQSAGDVTVFACGPWNMMRRAAEISAERGVECLCSLERYMACGFGVCLACVFRKTGDEQYHTCCQEGPVVDGREVNWDV